MSKQVSKSRFKAQALAIFREIEETGETVVVTDHGKPALQVSRYRAPADPLSELAGTVLHFDRPTDPVDDDAWEADR